MVASVDRSIPAPWLTPSWNISVMSQFHFQVPATLALSSPLHAVRLRAIISVSSTAMMRFILFLLCSSFFLAVQAVFSLHNFNRPVNRNSCSLRQNPKNPGENGPLLEESAGKAKLPIDLVVNFGYTPITNQTDR